MRQVSNPFKTTGIHRERKFITKLFNHTPLKIAFTTQNTIGKLLSIKKTPNQEKSNKCRVYQLTCPDCNMMHIRQKGIPFHMGFQKQSCDYKFVNNKSKFAQHLHDNKYSTWPIENIMDVIRTMSKGRLLDTTERFYIHNETCRNNQISDKCTAKPKVVFETVTLEDTDRAHFTS
jgi:hypothetical protein